MVRHEERIDVRASEWRPYERVRIRKVVLSEEVTEAVTVRREELVIDDERISAVERLEASFGTALPPPPDNFDMILHREEVVVTKRVVAYERVRVRTTRVSRDHDIDESVRRERIEVDRVSLD